jgi:hypothetical protein
MEHVRSHFRHCIADEARQRWINGAGYRAHFGSSSTSATKYRDGSAVGARPLRLLLAFSVARERNQVNFVTIEEILNQVCGYQAKTVVTRQTRDHL